MPTITRERTRPGLRMVEAHNFPAAMLVSRPHDDAQVVIVVVDQATPAPMLRGLARLMLRDQERRHLSRFLDLRRKR